MRFYGPLLLTCFLLVPSKGAQKSSDKPTTQGDRAILMQKDYKALTGRWQLVKSIVDGKPVPEDELRKTTLITDHNVFRFPADAGVGTAPQGRFTIDPTKLPSRWTQPPLPVRIRVRVYTRSWTPLTSAPVGACRELLALLISPAHPGSDRTVQYWRLISKESGD